LPGTAQIGILRVNLKFSTVIAPRSNRFTGNQKAMNRLAFAIVGTAALTLAACNNNNQDAVNNAEINQPDADQLNELANQAAMDAAANQAAAQNAINQAVNEQNASVDNTVNPKEADEQNVSGM
jgi:hypothetical protein